MKRTVAGALGVFVMLPALATQHVVVLEGLGGEPGYREEFARQVAAIEQAARSVTDSRHIQVFRGNDTTRTAILDYFSGLPARVSATDQVAVYLVGHGSYDGHEYKFNIPGPDLSGADIAEMLDGLVDTHQLLVSTGSASGALAESVPTASRLLVLATKSGMERHATRFGEFFARALADPGADTDKNQVVTVAEAFAYAAREVEEFFARDRRLSTEHPRLEGANAARFPLARLGAPTPDRSDPQMRQLIAERAAINARIDALRLTRGSTGADDYQTRLLEQVLELARVEDDIERRQQELDGAR